MKLWILRARDEELPANDNPWCAEFDMNYSMVIRAETENRARQLAHEQTGHENDDGEPWLDPKYTTCQELTADGGEEVVCVDYKRG